MLNQEGSDRIGSMEDIRKVASAAYAKLTEEERTKMESEFKSMDKSGDGKIGLHDFTKYTPSFFSLLDRKGNGFLQFEEFSTLKYIEESGRPFCAACRDFIPATFFACTQCRLSQNTPPLSYDLCIKCYREGNFDHHHAEFEDNYKFLSKLQRMLLVAHQQARPSRSPRSSPSRAPERNPDDQSGSSCLARLKKRMKKLSGLGKDVLGAIAASLVTCLFSAWQCCNDDDDGRDEADANPKQP